MLELSKYNTWEGKLEIFHGYFPKELNVLAIKNQKLLCSTLYNHIIAIRDHNIASLPRLKTPITLLKPTFPISSFAEEDYGLYKVNEIWIKIFKIRF